MLQSLDGAFYRRLAVTAAALAAYRLGTQLPVPGLVTQSVAEAFKPVDLAVARLSIFALGITPLLSALILAEIVKIIAPTVRRWEGIHYAVIVAALLLASVQGASIAGALQDVPNLVAEPGTSFRLVCTATLVAGAALVIALAAVIDRAGLGMGVWLIFLAPALAELPQNLAAIAQLYEVGQYSAAAIARSALFTAIATAGVVSIMLAARHLGRDTYHLRVDAVHRLRVAGLATHGHRAGDQRGQHRRSGRRGDAWRRHTPGDAPRRHYPHRLAVCALLPPRRPSDPDPGSAHRRRAGSHRPGGRDTAVAVADSAAARQRATRRRHGGGNEHPHRLGLHWRQ